MSLFEDRQRAFEAKVAHEDQKSFLVSSLRSRMMAAWAADILGKTGSDAEAYVDQIVQEQMSGALSMDCETALLDRLSADLDNAVSSATIAAHMKLSDESARNKIENGH